MSRYHVKRPGYEVFPVDVAWEREQAVPMRDGITIYGDVFRPADGVKAPVIILWSLHGKASTGSKTYDVTGPWHIGIPRERLSG
ncbi:hypothetical protein N7532_003580 [Penicillium argentinense]|uniref:Alpha/beta hydrolase n=1 Tax=Penicillium argentinense TaxID=1131581 RepID=A0A9W9KEN4_9EURO|nr:uncharacterized protein N7532_003580 [Penicillium argentinense]KAJ5103051.1 hypothetical protein N7532_003580 [Penicillium argentinense]